MSLGLLDGAEHQIPSPPLFDTSSFTPAIYSANGRYGGIVYQTDGSTTFYRWRILAASQDVENWIGWANYNGNNLGGSTAILTVYGDGSTTTHLSLYAASDGSLSLYRGTSAGTLLGTTATGLLALATWAYIELYCLIDNTTGAYELRVDGVNVLSASGVDTQNGGTPTVTVIGMNRPSVSSVIHRLDDIYVVTGDGTGLSGFQGEISIEGIKPNAAGNYTQLTPVGSATNWQNVDDVPFSSVDYNGSTTVGNKDTYGLANLTATTGTIIGTVHHMAWLKFFAGFIKGREVIRIGGVDYNRSDTPSLSATMRPFSEIIEESPATSAPWTISEVNGMEAGGEVRSA